MGAFFFLIYANALWQGKWVSDDGYIYLTYVKNFINHGELSFNLGERVDACTSYLWLAILAFISKLGFFDIRQSTLLASFFLSFASFGVVFLRAANGAPWHVYSLFLIFFPYFMRSFSTSGLETPIQILGSIMVYFHLKSRPWAGFTAFLIGSLPFVRPELGIILVIYALLLTVRKKWRVLGALCSAVFLYSSARWMTFGDVLPNTAFAKIGVNSYYQGAHYFIEFILSYPWVILLTLGLLPAAIKVFRQPSLTPVGTVILPSILVTYLYTYKTGGDFMHGRFLITPYVFSVLLCVDFYSDRIVRLRDLISPRVQTSLILALALLVWVAQPHARRHDNWYHKISDEQLAWAKDNKDLSHWRTKIAHPAAAMGVVLSKLSEKVHGPVGILVGAIGQRGFFTDSRRVYIGDAFSLVDVRGTLLDMKGYFRRPGHVKIQPSPLIYRNPRINLYHTPDDQLNTLLRFNYEGLDFTLINFDDIERFEKAGLLTHGTLGRAQERVKELISKTNGLDHNFVYYLYHRYRLGGDIFKEVEAIYNRQEVPSFSWKAWEQSHADVLQVADHIQSGYLPSLPFRYTLLVSRNSMSPVTTVFNEVAPVYNTVPCALRLNKSHFSGSAAKVDDDGTNLTFYNPKKTEDIFVSADLVTALKSTCRARGKHAAIAIVPTRAEGSSWDYYYLAKGRKKQKEYFANSANYFVNSDFGSSAWTLSFKLRPHQRYIFDVRVVSFD